MGCKISSLCGVAKSKPSNQYIMRNTKNRVSLEEMEQINQVVSGQQAITKETVKGVWTDLLTPILLDVYENFLFNVNTLDRTNIDPLTFGAFYIDFVNGENSDRLAIWVKILEDEQRPNSVRISYFEQYLSHMIRSFLLLMQKKQLYQYVSWTEKGCRVRDSTIIVWVSYLMRFLKKPAETEFISLDELRTWMLCNPDIISLQCMLFSGLYNMGISTSGFTADTAPLPFVKIKNFRGDNFPFMLDIPSIMFLNMHLPSEYRENWRLLFSTEVNGESFSNFYTSIINRGATVVVIKDIYGYVFGGFAPVGWHISPKFYGDARSFLFTLAPTMNIYTASYGNNNFQYLNVKQRTLPNGLGMGGQMGYIALWLYESFDYGTCTPTCVTFGDYKRLSGADHFRINGIEVWGVESEVQEDEDNDFGFR